MQMAGGFTPYPPAFFYSDAISAPQAAYPAISTHESSCFGFPLSRAVLNKIIITATSAAVNSMSIYADQAFAIRSNVP